MDKGFSDQVKKLLRRLDDIKAPGGSLGQAFAYVAAMHAENLRFLSRPVLAHLLGCDETTLRKEVIRPLTDEAAVQSQGEFILTRHRRVDEMAIGLLEEEGEDRFEMLADLAVAAVQAFIAGNDVPKLGSWRYGIVDQIQKGRRPDQAVRLARRLVEFEPDNIQSLVKLSGTLRETGDVEAAFGVFRSAPDAITRDRVFYYEWSTAAGNAGNYALNVWLVGVSLSDADGLPRLGAQQIKLLLAGLGAGCKEVYATSRERTFLHARAAVGELGLRLPDGNVERGYLLRHRDEAEEEGIEAMSVDAAVRAIEEAVFRAFDLSDIAKELADEGVPHRDEIFFRSLRDFPWRQG